MFVVKARVDPAIPAALKALARVRNASESSSSSLITSPASSMAEESLPVNIVSERER